jgi:molybdopterin converting factor small subunit
MPVIQVRLFAIARQMAGRESVAVDLPAGGRVRELRARLGVACPPLAALAWRMMFAVNAEYAADDLVIPENGEVACIPPVSGGQSQDRK